MYVITGATGNTGKPIALSLLAAGKMVRVISRSEEKAKELSDKGAEVLIGDSSDETFLAKAFEGSDTVYAMIPPDWTAVDFYAYQKKMADAIVSAVKKSGVKNVVSLSSVGTHIEENSGVIFGLRYLEQQLNSVDGLNVLHLRPTYFMENVFAQIPIIKHNGIMGSPVKCDITLSMIATKDIADYAAKRLLALNFSGKSVQYLLGQREVTYNEVAKIIGAAIGKPDLAYFEFPYDGLKQALMGMGASESLADSMNTFIGFVNEGKVLGDLKRDAENTTPTSIEEFANTFAYVYNLPQ
jgi:uncharacterized protein YbjT (DUF2867 family)